MFNNPAAQKDVTSFKTDIFGNIVPANAGPVAGVGNQKVAQSLVKPDDEKKYSEEDIKKLKGIRNGLLEARERLKNIA